MENYHPNISQKNISTKKLSKSVTVVCEICVNVQKPQQDNNINT